MTWQAVQTNGRWGVRNIETGRYETLNGSDLLFHFEVSAQELAAALNLGQRHEESEQVWTPPRIVECPGHEIMVGVGNDATGDIEWCDGRCQAKLNVREGWSEHMDGTLS